VSADSGARQQLEAIFREALGAVDSAAAVRRAVSGDARRLAIAGRVLPHGARVHLVAVGKAAAPMAVAFEERAGSALVAGLAVTKDGHGRRLTRVELRETSHPLPDARSERAAREVLALLRGLRPDDVLCALLSGGASSLLACPSDGLDLGDLAATTRLLLDAGSGIEETNAVRKHLSAVAGGRLAQACRAEWVEVLAISDVPGDRLDVIGSGPFAADPTTFATALAVLEARNLLDRIPPRVRSHLEAGARGRLEETAKPGDPALTRVRTTILASNRTAVEAARDAALRRGLMARVVSKPLAGEAREAARELISLARRARPEQPLLLVAGGETSVTVRGRGRGGRNQELALAAALELEGGPRATLLAAGTDGGDGPTEAAGAFADAATVERGRRAGRDARAALEDNDSHGFFEAEGGLFVTGPTGTNVMDLALLCIEPADRSTA